MRGGFTELRRIATVADTWGMLIAPHCFDELMGHLMCAIPNPHMLEYMGWLEDLLVAPVPVRNGTMRPPERPGDRKSVGRGKSVSVRVDIGGRRLIKKKKHTPYTPR